MERPDLNAQFGSNFTSAPLFNCDPNLGTFSAFLHCTPVFNANTHILTVTYSGVLPPEDPPTPGEVEDDAEGIPPNGHFIIDLNNCAHVIHGVCLVDQFRLVGGKIQGVGGWVSNSQIGFTAVVTPEPRLIALLLAASVTILVAHHRFRRPS